MLLAARSIRWGGGAILGAVSAEAECGTRFGALVAAPTHTFLGWEQKRSHRNFWVKGGAVHGGEDAGGVDVAMLQGASRGLGLEFVRQFLSRRSSGHVVATCRTPESAGDLRILREQHPGRLSILPLDVTVEGSIEAAAKAVGVLHGRVDVLVNTAGILHIENVLQPGIACRNRAASCHLGLATPHIQNQCSRPHAGRKAFCRSTES